MPSSANSPKENIEIILGSSGYLPLGRRRLKVFPGLPDVGPFRVGFPVDPALLLDLPADADFLEGLGAVPWLLLPSRPFLVPLDFVPESLPDEKVFEANLFFFGGRWLRSSSDLSTRGPSRRLGDCLLAGRLLGRRAETGISNGEDELSVPIGAISSSSDS